MRGVLQRTDRGRQGQRGTRRARTHQSPQHNHMASSPCVIAACAIGGRASGWPFSPRSTSVRSPLRFVSPASPLRRSRCRRSHCRASASRFFASPRSSRSVHFLLRLGTRRARPRRRRRLPRRSARSFGSAFRSSKTRTRRLHRLRRSARRRPTRSRMCPSSATTSAPRRRSRRRPRRPRRHLPHSRSRLRPISR